MSIASIAFKVGDSVVYPTQGAGRIVGEVERNIAGKTNNYFEIELVKGSTKVLIPVGQSQTIGLRRITEEKRVPELLQELSLPDLELPLGWTPRHRREQQIIAEGDIFRIARLVGTLARRDVERSLSATEHKMMEDARHMVATEIALALDIPLEEANARIGRAMG
jgi:CarD family transcriptional regulator